jgi:predicted HicB family RNase H-like nuclease
LAYSDAQKEATARYNKKAYDRIEIKVKKGRKQEIVAYAAKKQKSVNQFIVDLINKELNS